MFDDVHHFAFEVFGGRGNFHDGFVLVGIEIVADLGFERAEALGVDDMRQFVLYQGDASESPPFFAALSKSSNTGSRAAKM